MQDYDPSEPLSAEDEEYLKKASDYPMPPGSTGPDWARADSSYESGPATLSAADLVGKLIV